ncbi:MAG: hypothetical protein DRJ31_07825 [Candidatus Methanomethylicota archaeon]|uniref:Uncharacterized protein n=1 Tax=Thermoproteota archaeon TaxID=2056631 RepID=A0A497EME3_9CREN|nr:MAG: hypothetical protein DRJ31_07825 [Candidatus Verstraetearchaeota archaeon]
MGEFLWCCPKCGYFMVWCGAEIDKEGNVCHKYRCPKCGYVAFLRCEGKKHLRYGRPLTTDSGVVE